MDSPSKFLEVTDNSDNKSNQVADEAKDDTASVSGHHEEEGPLEVVPTSESTVQTFLTCML
jgi:hypothetical protein